MHDSSGAAQAGGGEAATAGQLAPGQGEHYAQNALMIHSMPVIPGTAAPEQGTPDS